MSNPFITSIDSYKSSHWLQADPTVDQTYFYITARQPTKDLSATMLRQEELPFWLEMQTKLPKDLFGNVVFMGLQPYLKKYFIEKSIDQAAIQKTSFLMKKHGEPFNQEGFELLRRAQFNLKLNAGTDYWPMEIRALPEGSLVPVGTPMVTGQSMPNYPWFPSYSETSLLRAIWYPTTVATTAWQVKQVCKYFLKLTGGDKAVTECLPFMLHDFGARGVSSAESAGIGGLAHLTQFRGTDNLEGYTMALDDYDADIETLAFSVPAAEHSTIMSWGKDRETEAISHIMDVHKDYPIVSIVSDTYDLDNAINNILGGSLYVKVRDSKNRNVPRPDSGPPVETVVRTLFNLWGKFGGTTNAQGFKVLPANLRVLQGDGVHLYSIFRILYRMWERGFAAENLVFGMGGALLQKCDRDTYAFAMKLSAIKRKGEDKWTGVKKTVATDSKKQSAAGRFYVAYTGPLWHTFDLDALETGKHMDSMNMLQLVWDGYSMVRRQTFDEIRNLTSAV